MSKPRLQSTDACDDFYINVTKQEHVRIKLEMEFHITVVTVISVVTCQALYYLYADAFNLQKIMLHFK